MAKKDKSLAPFSIQLPSKLQGMTIDNFFHTDGAEIHISKNKISARRVSDEGVTTVQFEGHNTGRHSYTESHVPHQPKKADYIDDILAMKKAGYKQKDIAFELGISPSYVAYLLKNYQEQ